MSESPLVSIVMVVRNGMPYLPMAIASLKAQTYQNFELIVQDGESTDGTLEFLKTIKGLSNIKIQSSPDRDHHPYNQAISRCNGEIIGSLADDDLLEPKALETAVDFFTQHPTAAVIYGDCNMINQDGSFSNTFEPSPFDLLDVLECKLVPPLAVAFFSRSRCGDALSVDETQWACYDYALWLRLSHLPIVKIPTVLGSVRISEESNTCRADMYELMCDNKISILKHYLARYGQTPLIEKLYERAVAGIYAWAAESMLWIPTGTPEWFDFYYEKALALNPTSERLKTVKLQQELTQTRNELYPLRDEHNRVTHDLARTQEKLERSHQELQQTQYGLQQAQIGLQQYQEALEHKQAALDYAQKVIAAMESSKFWQLRNVWMKLRKNQN
ncbi:glycosyltransferase [Kovacikia minuta CCNUW1]|uniref:glycosyltransferase n=1 Tax=Kovacikia minuta TaxID=2931930 RepID=UPI001CC969D0|nr:glycosyltransferase [Kovacikia minuta]UBF25408.1 glycosyltransferase [Kovacikia minuta CCNUW1]